jgi:SAM-dependent methyltransferase
MFDLGFAPGSFDLVWSEGAIYTLGFEAGLAACRRLLKSGGCAAFTELTWLKPEPPAEIAAYWGAEYPGMGSIASNRQSILRQGYREVGQFTLPETSWWDPYYTPIEARIGQLRLKYAGDAGVNHQLDDHQREVDHFRRYSSWYGYVFYIVQTP